jgi:hypothetical protein
MSAGKSKSWVPASSHGLHAAWQKWQKNSKQTYARQRNGAEFDFLKKSGTHAHKNSISLWTFMAKSPLNTPPINTVRMTIKFQHEFGREY